MLSIGHLYYRHSRRKLQEDFAKFYIRHQFLSLRMRATAFPYEEVFRRARQVREALCRDEEAYVVCVGQRTEFGRIVLGQLPLLRNVTPCSIGDRDLRTCARSAKKRVSFYRAATVRKSVAFAKRRILFFVLAPPIKGIGEKHLGTFTKKQGYAIILQIHYRGLAWSN